MNNTFSAHEEDESERDVEVDVEVETELDVEVETELDVEVETAACNSYSNAPPVTTEHCSKTD